MQNLQNIPGETDLEQPMPDDRAPSEEKRVERKDVPLPPDKIPSAPVSEPPTPDAPKPVDEDGGAQPQRIMSYFTAAQRRIF